MNLLKIRRALGRLYTQLRSGSGTEGEDCGAVTVANLIRWASRGKIGPQTQRYGLPNSIGAWVKRIRYEAHRPSGPMMIFGDCFEALTDKDIRDQFHNNGLTPPSVEYKYGQSYKEMRDFLQESEDHALLLPINYGVARASGAPMGSTSFSGGHAIMMTGLVRRRVRVGKRRLRRWVTIVGDPLFDGRTKPNGKGRYPKGFREVRLYRYFKAAGAFGTAPDGSPRPIGEGRTVTIQVVRH